MAAAREECETSVIRVFGGGEVYVPGDRHAHTAPFAAR